MTFLRQHRWILKYSAISFAAFLVLGLLLVTLAYAIPNDWIEGNAVKSIEMVMEEYRNDPNREWSGMFDDDANTINYGCDRKWMRRAIVDDPTLNALEAAMSVNGYTRYWHGYQIFVRPMLAVGTYENMVYISVLVFFALVILCCLKLYQRFRAPVAAAFFLSLYLVRMIATSLCLNNSGCFVAAMGMILFVLAFTDTDREKWLYPLFLLDGMFVNYMDVLTAPLVSLGLPLAVYLMMKLTGEREPDLKSNLIDTVSMPVFWAVGYGVFWAMKWLIGSLVLGRNIITDAVEQAGFRIAGDAAHATTPIDALIVNFAVLTPDDAFSKTLIVIAVILMALIVLVFHKKISRLLQGIPLLLVAVSPILWMIVLSNHSQIHAPFVFRILAVFLFAMLCLFIYAVDWGNFRRTFHNMKRKKQATC